MLVQGGPEISTPTHLYRQITVAMPLSILFYSFFVYTKQKKREMKWLFIRFHCSSLSPSLFLTCHTHYYYYYYYYISRSFCYTSLHLNHAGCPVHRVWVGSHIINRSIWKYAYKSIYTIYICFHTYKYLALSSVADNILEYLWDRWGSKEGVAFVTKWNSTLMLMYN